MTTIVSLNVFLNLKGFYFVHYMNAAINDMLTYLTS